MLKKISLFVATLGVFLAAGFMLSASETGLKAQEDARGCAPRAVALDEGYGVTRVEVRPACGDKR